MCSLSLLISGAGHLSCCRREVASVTESTTALVGYVLRTRDDKKEAEVGKIADDYCVRYRVHKKLV